jgi:hypothetical protein
MSRQRSVASARVSTSLVSLSFGTIILVPIMAEDRCDHCDQRGVQKRKDYDDQENAALLRVYDKMYGDLPAKRNLMVYSRFGQWPSLAMIDDAQCYSNVVETAACFEFDVDYRIETLAICPGSRTMGGDPETPNLRYLIERMEARRCCDEPFRVRLHKAKHNGSVRQLEMVKGPHEGRVCLHPHLNDDEAAVVPAKKQKTDTE